VKGTVLDLGDAVVRCLSTKESKEAKHGAKFGIEINLDTITWSNNAAVGMLGGGDKDKNAGHEDRVWILDAVDAKEQRSWARFVRTFAKALRLLCSFSLFPL
jgi:hypothetical protein